MLVGVNKDDIEADGGNGFVRPFANEYEDYSGDGIEDGESDVESEDQPMEEYDDEDYYQSGGIGEKARRRGGIAKKQDPPFKDYEDMDNQSRGVGEYATTIRGDDVLHGNAKGINESRGDNGNTINQHDEAGNDILFEETYKREVWSREINNVEVEDEEDWGIKDKDPSEKAAGQWKSARRSNEERESEDTSKEAPGWSAEIFGATAILFAMLLLLILTFLLCKWR